MSNFLPLLGFQATSLWRAHLALSLGLLLSLAVVAGTSCALVIASLENRGQSEELLAMITAKKVASNQPDVGLQDGAEKAAKLPPFSSGEFISQFHEEASSVGIPVEEVTYVLESDDNKPYLRYKVTMSVRTRYLNMRKFIAAVSSDMPNVSLDTIQCGRESANALPLNCQLGFSAFFIRG